MVISLLNSRKMYMADRSLQNSFSHFIAKHDAFVYSVENNISLKYDDDLGPKYFWETEHDVIQIEPMKSLNCFVVVTSHKHLHFITISRDKIHYFPTQQIETVLSDKTEQFLYICRDKQILIYNRETGSKSVMFSCECSLDSSQPNTRMTSFLMDENKETLYVGTNFGKIYVFFLNDLTQVKTPVPLFDEEGDMTLMLQGDEYILVTSNSSDKMLILYAHSLYLAKRIKILAYQDVTCIMPSKKHGRIFFAYKHGVVGYLSTERWSFQEKDLNTLDLPYDQRKLINILLLNQETELICNFGSFVVVLSLPEMNVKKMLKFKAYVNQMIELPFNLLLMQLENGRVKLASSQDFTDIEELPHKLTYSWQGVSITAGLVFMPVRKEIVICYDDSHITTYCLLNQFDDKPTVDFKNLSEGFGQFCNLIRERSPEDGSIIIPAFLKPDSVKLKDKVHMSEFDVAPKQVDDEHTQSPIDYYLSISDQLVFIQSEPKEIQVLDPKSYTIINKRLLAHKPSLLSKIEGDQPKIFMMTEDSIIIVFEFPSLKILRKIDSLKTKKLRLKCFNSLSQKLYFSTDTFEIFGWNVEGGTEPQMIGWHESEINYLVVSQPHNLLFSNSMDKVFKVWNLTLLTLVKQIVLSDMLIELYLTRNLALIYTQNKKNVHQIESLVLPELTMLTKVAIENKKEMSKSLVVTKFTGGSTKVYRRFGEYFYKSSDFGLKFDKSWKLSNLEINFICNSFLESSLNDTTKFIAYFSRMRKFYESSTLLKTYFSVYLACAFRKNLRAFKQLVTEEKVDYEFSEDQIDPFEYLARVKELELLKNVLKLFKKRKLYLELRYELVQLLLTTIEKFGKEFLVNNIRTVKDFEPSGAHIKKLGQFKQFQIIQQRSKAFTPESYDAIQSTHSKDSNRNIEIFNLNIIWDFDSFTETSLIFLKQFAYSQNDNFVMSPYCHIVNYKWRTVKWYFLIQTLIQWMHLIFYFLYVSNSSTIAFFVIDFMMLGLLFVYEIWNILAAGRHYLSDPWNIFDLFNIAGCTIFLILTNSFLDEIDMNAYRILLLCSLIATTWRGFTFFKFLSGFSHITQMTIGMIKNSFSLVVITAYFSVCISVILNQTYDEPNIEKSLLINYNIIYGNLPDFDDTTMLMKIMVLLSSLMLPIFFINFLIAKLSSSYSDLENRQKVLALKELARSILEYETMIGFVLNLLGRNRTVSLGHVFVSVDVKANSEITNISEVDYRFKRVFKEIKTMNYDVNKRIAEVEAVSQQVSTSIAELGHKFESEIQGLNVRIKNELSDLRHLLKPDAHLLKNKQPGNGSRLGTPRSHSALQGASSIFQSEKRTSQQEQRSLIKAQHK